jgi:predicted aspartyl protease
MISVGMGFTVVTVKIYGEKGAQDLELLVDTGSLLTWIPREVLEAVGVKTLGRKKFKTIEGRIVERDVGETLLELMGEKATRLVVFGEKGDAQVLGVEALEGLGFEVDPVTKQLKKIEAFIAY